MNNFTLATKVYFGKGELKMLKEMKSKRVFIVTDPFIVSSGLIDNVTEQLVEANMDYKIFSDIVPDPPIELVAKGIKVMDEYNPDLLISIGGGSALDAAKAISYFRNRIKTRTDSKEQIEKLLFIAIPTTSGTGSEVTSFSVITNKETNVKYPIIEEDIVPDIAILDSELVKTVPKSITADTGIDVLTHAIEAYVSKSANDFSDALCEKAIKLVFGNLENAYIDGMNMEAREKMHNASCIAGIAFNNVSLGINHSMAHVLGAKFNISHGKANALFLPYVIEYNSDILSNQGTKYNDAANKYAEISKFLGFSSTPNNIRTKEDVILLILGVKKLIKKVGIPDRIKDLDIKEVEFEENLSEMCDIALKDRCTLTNPKEVTKEDLAELFRKAYNGR